MKPQNTMNTYIFKVNMHQYCDLSDLPKVKYYRLKAYTESNAWEDMLRIRTVFWDRFDSEDENLYKELLKKKHPYIGMISLDEKLGK